MFSFWKVKSSLSGRITDLEGKGSENDREMEVGVWEAPQPFWHQGPEHNFSTDGG